MTIYEALDKLNFFFDMLSETDILTEEQFDLMNKTEDCIRDFVDTIFSHSDDDDDDYE